MKIKYSDFLLRIIDLKREIRAEDIASAFNHIDSDKSGKIESKDLQNYLKRRGEDISEEEVKEMIKKAESKVFSVESISNKNDENSATYSNSNNQGELDYPTFK